jgi:glycerate kinase
MERGIKSVFPKAEVIKVPIADGGEGTVEALVCSSGGVFRKTTVIGPLGEPVEASWGILGDGETAVVEMAAASGLTLIPKEKRNPLLAGTFGTGQLVREVLDKGLRRLILGIGGSATNDGGVGFASALGIRFFDADGKDLPQGGASLINLAGIDLSGADPRLHDLEITVACDVDNPLCGPRGATAIFGPQKGVTGTMLPQLDTALAHYAKIAAEVTGRNIADKAGAGAAGGLGAGILFFTEAGLRPGIDIVLDTLDFRRLAAEADLVITGEGNSDRQTAYGKAPVGVAKAAKEHGVPVICLSGGLSEGYQQIFEQGIDAASACLCAPMSVEECMAEGATLVQHATERLCRILLVGKSLPQ